MSPRSAFDEPSQAAVVDGEVVVIGPEGVAHSFTPDAARETARRLAAAADEADQSDESSIDDGATAGQGDPKAV
jgi:hypothetical protein